MVDLPLPCGPVTNASLWLGCRCRQRSQAWSSAELPCAKHASTGSVQCCLFYAAASFGEDVACPGPSWPAAPPCGLPARGRECRKSVQIRAGTVVSSTMNVLFKVVIASQIVVDFGFLASEGPDGRTFSSLHSFSIERRPTRYDLHVSILQELFVVRLFLLSWNVSPGFGSEKLGWFGVRGGWPRPVPIILLRLINCIAA